MTSTDLPESNSEPRKPEDERTKLIARLRAGGCNHGGGCHPDICMCDLANEAADVLESDRAQAPAHSEERGGGDYVLVPRELTEAMIEVARSIDDGPLRSYQEHWDMMLAARPSPAPIRTGEVTFTMLQAARDALPSPWDTLNSNYLREAIAAALALAPRLPQPSTDAIADYDNPGFWKEAEPPAPQPSGSTGDQIADLVKRLEKKGAYVAPANPAQGHNDWLPDADCQEAASALTALAAERDEAALTARGATLAADIHLQRAHKAESDLASLRTQIEELLLGEFNATSEKVGLPTRLTPVSAKPEPGVGE